VEGEPILTALLIVARTAQIAASILITGIFTFELAVLRSAGPRESTDFHEVELRLFRLAVCSLVVALLSGLLWFWLEVASMSGSLTNALAITAWRTVLFETEFGRVWQLRLGVLAVAVALVALGLAQDELARTLILVLWLLSLGFLLSLAWVSHAAATRTQPLGLLGDAVHLCAAGVWLGGLAPLAIFLASSRASLSLSRGSALALHRFSTISLCCASVLVISGISNSWLLVGSIYALFTTPYGRLLLLKLTLFGILIVLGARNRFLVKAKLLKTSAGPDVLGQLCRNVICEVCFGALVVAVVACLGVTPPARH
jgi:copper resistance protein D